MGYRLTLRVSAPTFQVPTPQLRAGWLSGGTLKDARVAGKTWLGINVLSQMSLRSLRAPNVTTDALSQSAR